MFEVTARSRPAPVVHEAEAIPASSRLEHPRGVSVIIAVATALGLVLRLYQLARPNYLSGVTGYDDGVDFGSAVRLVNGAIPYRDFVLVQPPGISLLMAPAGWLATAVGTDAALAVARIVTACVGAGEIVLVGRLVRHRGPLATALACGILAVNPGAILASHSVLLEPWVVLFCLVGALAVFDGDDVTTGDRRLALGAVAFGLAGAIKVWAILPVVVVLVICWRARGHRAALTYVGGVAAGFLVVVLPFVAFAPRAFYNDVIVAQLSRVEPTRVSLAGRLDQSGWDQRPVDGGECRRAASLAVAAFVLVCAVGASLASRRPAARAGGVCSWHSRPDRAGVPLATRLLPALRGVLRAVPGVGGRPPGGQASGRSRGSIGSPAGRVDRGRRHRRAGARGHGRGSVRLRGGSEDDRSRHRR